MNDADICFLGAAELGRRIAEGSITSRRATEAYLARIAAVNPSIEAYVTVTAERALASAQARDAERAAGHLRGPLHGVPYCLKDIIATAGIRTTVGSEILGDWVPDRSATVVDRLEAAGAVLLGKVNTHEFAFGVTSWNTHARTRNPWDRTRIAGGSSGGSGAALAAGLATFSIGSDTAGSIRIPAAFCGITGLKPTFGRVSATGVVAQSYTSDHIGPMARSVEDLALIMDAIAGPDPSDPTCLGDMPPSHAIAPGAGVAGMRIGIPRELMAMPLQDAVKQGFDAACATFRRLGATVGDVSVPLLARARQINNAIVPPETAAQHRHWSETWFMGRTIRYGADVARLLEMGRAVSAVETILATRERARLGAELAALFGRDCDLLLTPTAAIVAPRAGPADRHAGRSRDQPARRDDPFPVRLQPDGRARARSAGRACARGAPGLHSADRRSRCGRDRAECRTRLRARAALE
jgi:aspartyl-tRNA(Asn)/glutamyl-tRNA(Gln) amidotransferase subunit A